MHIPEEFKKLAEAKIKKIKNKKEREAARLVYDLEVIIALQDDYIWIMERTLNAYCNRMWDYHNKINKYDYQLLQMAKHLEGKVTDKIRLEIADGCRKIKTKLRKLNPKEKRRYGPVKKLDT
jgi:hypothetical protein|tara:strand:+ start:160 stop:525 length:366 start_codon:yes stop_codon:yes gene_type:complete